MDFETTSSCLDPNSSYLDEIFFPISLYKVSEVKTCQLLEEWENLEEQVEIGFNSALFWLVYKVCKIFRLIIARKINAKLIFFVSFLFLFCS